MSDVYSKRDGAAIDAQADIVAALAARGALHQTPCGHGHVAWRRWGAGSPVVLFHGGAGTWTHWIRNIEALAERHTVWALDMPGFGDSAMPPELSIDSIASAVEQGLHMLIPDGQRLSIVAFSFGSSIATVVAARLGARVRNLILTGARFAKYSQRPTLHLVPWKKLHDANERLAAHRINLQELMIADPDKIDDLAVHLQATNTARARVSARKWKPGPSDKLHECFPRVRAERVTVIFGRGDEGGRKIMENDGVDLKADQPGVRLFIVDHAGHWAQYEAAESVNELLLSEMAAN